MAKKKRKKKSARRAAKPRKGLSSSRFPGETPKYRAARDKLLRSEIALRREIEKLAALRRRLPPGGLLAEDYVFEEMGPDGSTVRVRFSELFAPGKDTLAVYNFMYGPKMERACPSCTSILDAMDGNTQHISQRVNLVVVAKSPIERILAHARNRGWRRLRLLSSAGNSYNRDYFGEDAEGDQWPVLNVFQRQGHVIRHFWASELAFVKAEPGQHPRHVDFIWPLWNAFDLTPEGRGKDWGPKLSYGA